MSLATLMFGVVWLLWLSQPLDARRRGSGSMPRRAVRDAFGLPAPVRIRVTRHPALLVTWGAINPVILLPADADSWPAERVSLVLAHEMAHLARRDWLTQLAAEIVRAIHWFNPLFWLACARLRQESEHASDDIVLDLGFAPNVVCRRTWSIWRARSARTAAPGCRRRRWHVRPRSRGEFAPC